MIILIMNKFNDGKRSKYEIEEELKEAKQYLSEKYGSEITAYNTVNYPEDIPKPSDIFVSWFGDIVKKTADCDAIALPIGWTADKDCKLLYEVCRRYRFPIIQIGE